MPKFKKKVHGFFFQKVPRSALVLVFGFFIILASVSIYSLKQFEVPKCANSISCMNDLSGTYASQEEGVFMGHAVKPHVFLPEKFDTQVLGEKTGEKHIYVDLSAQKLTAFEGDRKVFDFTVATGKWGRTPVGKFKIWIKLLYTRMEGGSGSDYYNLPNVPYTMFFYNDEIAKSRGFALHGAYWHNNFGYPMSHGCVNIRPEDAAKLYEWVGPVAADGKNTTYASSENPGTSITIYGQTPES